MYDSILIIWLVIFLIFLIVNISQSSKAFGMIAGIWLMMLSLAIIVTGVQTESGMQITDVNDTTFYSYQYTDITLPFSTYSYIWGVILILVSFYIFYANVMYRNKR